MKSLRVPRPPPGFAARFPRTPNELDGPSNLFIHSSLVAMNIPEAARRF